MIFFETICHDFRPTSFFSTMNPVIDEPPSFSGSAQFIKTELDVTSATVSEVGGSGLAATKIQLILCFCISYYIEIFILPITLTSIKTLSRPCLLDNTTLYRPVQDWSGFRNIRFIFFSSIS